jgi:hypothetical protein
LDSPTGNTPRVPGPKSRVFPLLPAIHARVRRCTGRVTIYGFTSRKPPSQPGGEQKAATPSILLPKGGGAIHGMGEKFAANPVTGTGATSVPLATSPGRSGFGPQLSLSYDSGSGNGPFGFGWTLSVPAITRKTDKGLPQYRDAQESDVFILSSAEDLVPVCNADGSRFEDTKSAPGYTIHRYSSFSTPTGDYTHDPVMSVIAIF